MARERGLNIADFKGKGDRREVHPIPWPGTDKLVGLMELRCEEVLQSFFSARALFDKKGVGEPVDMAGTRAFSEELEVQYCFRMLVDLEAEVAKARLFKSADEARGALSPDERSHFVEQHRQFQQERVSSWAPPVEDEKPEDEKPEADAEQGDADGAQGES